jgi:hypothetical protein
LDPPKKKVYHDLSEQESELLEQLVDTLNKLYRNKDVFESLEVDLVKYRNNQELSHLKFQGNIS